MFDHLTNQQGLADQLKRLIRADNHAERGDRESALEKLIEFEGAQWQPQVFTAALAAAEPGRFEVADDRLTYHGVPGAHSVTLAASRVIGVYLAVLSTVLPQATYNVEAAAAYLGIKPETVRYHVYESGELKGERRERRLYFTKAELEAFKQQEHKPGPKAKRTVPTD